MALFVAAVLVGPVLLILWLGWSGYQRELRDAATRSQQLSTQIAEDRIGWTRSTRQLLVTFAQAEAVGQLDPDGCRALARALAEATPGIAGIAALEPDGRRICAAQPSASEPDPVDEALFARVLETKTMVVGDPATSPVSGAKLLPFLYPVLADGRVVTVVITSIDLIWLSQALGAVASGLGASAGILNGSGVVVAGWPGADTWIGKTISGRIRLEAAATRSRLNPTFVAQTADGVEQILSVRPFPVFGDTVLNNLLSIIIGNLDVLQDGSTVEKQPAMTATLVEEALNAALCGAELNRRLLAFARRQSLRPEVIEVGRALEGVADLLKRTLGERIRFETTVEPRTWPIEVDPSQLEAVLVNLAVNARDAMPDGGDLTIEATNTTLDRDYADTHVETTPGDYVVISVADTGSGMPPDVLNRVFEPFFTTKEVGRRTGLGLSMVHGFVRQSGGHVTIYSEVGHGTVVRIYLPRVASAVAAGLASPGEEKAQGQGQNILVVEDSEALRGVVVRMLTSLGYRALEAGDAASALQVLAARSEIDLLFTDVVIPGALDGIALAKQARAERPGLKVLLTSGFTERTTVRGNGHVDDREPLSPLLGKPYRKADLATAVLAALSNGQG